MIRTPKIQQLYLCDYCETMKPKNIIRRKAHCVYICKDCITERKEWINNQKKLKPDRKFFVYPKRPYILNIKENEVDKNNLKELFIILGYDPDKNIHNQFLERHNLLS